MTIYLGADHAGFELKEKIKRWLVSSLKFKEGEVVDFGALALDPSDDYPDFCRPVAEAVAKDSDSRGIIIGGSGQGEAMCANRVPGARAAVYYGESGIRNPADATPSSKTSKVQGEALAGRQELGEMSIIKLSREHNNANILSLGARFLTDEEALQAVQFWLETPFSKEERHVRRLAKF